MSEYLAFKWKMVWFGLVWFGLVWFGFSYFGSLSLVKFGTMQNLKSIGRELIEILRFINTVALVQFWLTLFFSGTNSKWRTLPSYALAVLKMSPILAKFGAIYLYKGAIWHKTFKYQKCYHVRAPPKRPRCCECWENRIFVWGDFEILLVPRFI